MKTLKDGTQRQYLLRFFFRPSRDNPCPYIEQIKDIEINKPNTETAVRLSEKIIGTKDINGDIVNQPPYAFTFIREDYKDGKIINSGRFEIFYIENGKITKMTEEFE